MASGSVRYLAGDVAVKVNKNSTRDMFFDIEIKPKFRVCNAAGAVENDDVAVSADAVIYFTSFFTDTEFSFTKATRLLRCMYLIITFRRGDPCLQAGEEAPPPFEFLLNRFVSFPADAASCS